MQASNAVSSDHQPEGSDHEPTDAQEESGPTAAAERAPSPELQRALDDAAAAVEGREAGSSGTSADEAVTEALLAAKKELEAALEQTKREASQLRDNWMRAAADLENYRKRAAREREDVQRYGVEKLLKDFLPVMDDLDRAMSMVSSGEVGSAGEQLLNGVQLVQKKFLSTLGKHGVTSFESAGQAFDPERHEAVQQAHHPEIPAGQVAQELQRGFMIHDRLLRPALVVVSLGAEGGDGAPSDE